MTSLYFYLSYSTSKMYSNSFYGTAMLTIVCLTMPIAGYLAYIRFGRYKVTSLLLTAGLVIEQLVDLKNDNHYLKIFL